MMKSVTKLTFLPALFQLIFSCSSPEPVILGTFLNEPLNREAKAEYLLAYFTGKQISCYDRKTPLL